MLHLHPAISIHALREEGDIQRRHQAGVGKDFYPRPPRGGRLRKGTNMEENARFLSTPSARRATRGKTSSYRKAAISIHALREEGDPPEAPAAADRLISIHALREEGDHSVDGAERHRDISIHALREEGDRIPG